MQENISLERLPDHIDPTQWNALAGDHPFARHEFLLALHETGCAAPKTGWAPHYLLLRRGAELVGSMPLYLKSHSRGEYVFDMSWARAFETHGLDYYPKVLSAIPFTPIPGPRLLAHNHADRVALARAAIEITRRNELSSLHILFPGEADLEALRECGFMVRESVQFHWFNQGYQSLDDFLLQMNQKNRKKLRQDSRKARDAGVEFKWLQGSDIDSAALAFFYECYVRTYLEHGNAPYLSHDFFSRLHAAMPGSLVLIIAEQHGQPIAAALNLRSKDRLYGRYWGSTTFISGLHFETCYMQAIDFCIQHGIQVFEGGAQGEHKLSRGMLPVKTYSAHWVRDERYAQAIADFLDRESVAIDGYVEALHEHSPFKRPTP